jgi:hypothetical protein
VRSVIVTVDYVVGCWEKNTAFRVGLSEFPFLGGLKKSSELNRRQTHRGWLRNYKDGASIKFLMRYTE